MVLRPVADLIGLLSPSGRDNQSKQKTVDYLLVESTGISEPLLVAEPRLGRRTALTFPLVVPPQKN